MKSSVKKAAISLQKMKRSVFMGKVQILEHPLLPVTKNKKGESYVLRLFLLQQ